VRNVLALVLLASSVALTGCTQGDPGDDFGEPTCPSWTRGLNAQVVHRDWAITNQTTMPDFERWDYTVPGPTGSSLGGPFPEFQGRPLDFITIDLHQRTGGDPNKDRLLYIQDAELHAQFYAERDHELGEDLMAYEEGKPETAKHEWVFRTQPGGYLIENITWKVELAAPDQEPDPHGVYVRWTLVPNLDNDIDTASVVLMRYSPEFWYRTCSADGTRL
jgi:hypothetical protein